MKVRLLVVLWHLGLTSNLILFPFFSSLLLFVVLSLPFLTLGSRLSDHSSDEKLTGGT